MNKKIFLIVLGAIIFSLTFVSTLWYFKEPNFTSPLNSLTTFKFIKDFTAPKNEPETQKKVYGFLPYWNLNKVQLAPELTHLAYFGLTLDSEGKILTKSKDGSPDPGYQKLKDERLLELNQEIKNRGGKFEIVLAQFDNETIEELLNNDQAQKNLIQSIDSILLAYPIDGINLDIEYSGTVNTELRNKFTNLVTAIRQHLNQKYDNIELSLDLYASAASRNLIWDIEKLEPQLDQFVVMAYDFHRPNSPQAGPVAPLFGGKDSWESDINQNLAKFSKLVPKEKLLLGIPFYGYQWQTTSRQAQAKTYPNTGRTMEINKVKELLDPEKKEEYQVEENWHQEALSPYLTYVKDDQTYVVYYENALSLSYKIDYVNHLNMAGIAIWALGYEDIEGELWFVIDQRLQ